MFNLPQVGVFTDPNVAKLTAMKNVCTKSSLPPQILKYALRHLPLWNPKPTFRSKYMTKVCAVLNNVNPRSHSLTLFLQLFQNRPKLAGRTPSLGRAPATLVISSRAQVAHTLREPFADIPKALAEAP